MIDFHAHILPGVDDGSKNFEESYNLIEEAKKAGFTKIIATPHYMQDYYEVNKHQQQNRIKLLNNNSNGLEIIPGNEIYANEKMYSLLKDETIATIGSSNYILVEFPMHNRPFDLEDYIYRIQNAGYIPIIAHPERYDYVKENPNMLIELIEMGALFQANYGSLIGIYGKNAKKTVKKLLKNNMIHFMGSDVHKENSIYPKMPQIIQELRKIISDETFENLTNNNIEKMLKNEQFEVNKPIKIKKSFLGRLFR